MQVLVKSTAIPEDNPEVVEARRRNIAIIPRAEMLAELMRLRQGVAIAGTHGKTTTTSLTASIFDTAGLDPTVIIGGRLNVYGTNAHLGSGHYLIAEADESDGSFLCLFPIINVVTNVDEDHLDHYGTRQAIDDAFVQFMNKVPFYGLNVVCGDDPGVRALLPRVKRPVLTYGFAADNQLRAVLLESGMTSRFEVWRGEVKLSVRELVEFLLRTGSIDSRFAGFDRANEGARIHRKLQKAAGEGYQAEVFLSETREVDGIPFTIEGRADGIFQSEDGVTVIDDYGHHPAEIAATLATARQVFPGRRLVVAFQPHRFSRTQAHFGEFCKVFDVVDQLVLTEIYAASEKPIPGVSGESLAQGMRQVSETPVTYFQTIDAMVRGLDDILRPGDVLLTLGAGTITRVGPAWLEGGKDA